MPKVDDRIPVLHLVRFWSNKQTKKTRKELKKMMLNQAQAVKTGAHLGGECRGSESCPFWFSPNCALKFLNQFRRNTLKNQFKKRKNPASLEVTNEQGIKDCRTKEFRTNSWETRFHFQTYSTYLTPRQLFSLFHSMCYPIFRSFTIFNFKFFENLKTILETSFNKVKPLNSEHLLVLKNCPLLKGVRHWEVV